jgi:membrane fusion protein, multidrug efflux system
MHRKTNCSAAFSSQGAYMKKMIAFFILSGLIAFLIGCSKKTAMSKSMDAIYRESGVPVTVQTLETSELHSECLFHSTLSGVEETSVSAMVTDKVEKILFAVGDRVKKDEIVMLFPTDNPATPYVQTKTAFEHAGTTLARIKNLYDNGGISLQEYENTRTQYEVTKANWESVQRMVKAKAPIQGVITQISVREADNVKSGDKLFTVADTGRLKTQVWVTEDRAASIEKGAPATAAWRDVAISGNVVQIDKSLDPKHQAFGAVIEFANPGGRMNNGVNAEIRVNYLTSGQALVIDRKNVSTEGDSTFVFVARDSLAIKRPVVLGRRYETDVEVIRGLKPGDRLITKGQMLLEDKTKIRIVQE